jgi:signal transduction histidine kinase
MPEELKILLVEDDEDDYILVRDAFRDLSRLRVRLDWARGLGEASGMIKDIDYDAYLLDYQLHDGLGLQLMEGPLAECSGPVIFLTGRTDYETDLKVMRAGAADYIQKSALTPELLERSLRYAIRTRLQERILRDALDELETRIVERTSDLRATNRDLMREIELRQRREKELEEARERAENASRAKSAFLANMSHEIRTPIGGIMGLTEVLISRAADGKEREYLGMIRHSADSLLALVNDILDISRVEARKMKLEIAPFDLPAMLGKLHRIFRIQAEEKGLGFELRLGPGLPGLVSGDCSRIEQILNNLLSNALKFTSRGLVALEAAPLGPGHGGAHEVRFVVEDTGPGIPGDQRHRLFQCFEQLDSSYSKRHQGTGLGLAICRSLSELMGGRVEVESTPGRGSRFIVVLPLPPAGDAPRVLPADGEHLPEVAAGLSVLLAEDNEINRTFLTDFLSEAGCRVEVAANGLEAIRLLGRRRYDVVLMDVQMPVMNGIEATRAIRSSPELPSGPDVPVVALTAYAMKGDGQRFLDAGMDAHVSKPVDLPVLLQTMHRLASRRRGATAPD